MLPCANCSCKCTEAGLKGKSYKIHLSYLGQGPLDWVPEGGHKLLFLGWGLFRK